MLMASTKNLIDVFDTCNLLLEVVYESNYWLMILLWIVVFVVFGTLTIKFNFFLFFLI